MIDIHEYMCTLMKCLRDTFQERLLYIGLQGSYMRGEATEHSDIDVVVILDELKVKDLDKYKRIISNMEESEKSCGFICGKQEMKHWNPLEICHLVYSTEDYYGRLADLVSEYNECDILNFIKLSVNNLYHEICHRYIHFKLEKNKRGLVGSYKNVFFILQNIYFVETGIFAKTKKELMGQLRGIDKQVMEMHLEVEKNDAYAFERAFELLFKWCQEVMKERC